MTPKQENYITAIATSALLVQTNCILPPCDQSIEDQGKCVQAVSGGQIESSTNSGSSGSESLPTTSSDSGQGTTDLSASSHSTLTDETSTTSTTKLTTYPDETTTHPEEATGQDSSTEEDCKFSPPSNENICNDGNSNNNDACVECGAMDRCVCKDAACGDGFIWAGQEECDDGNLDDSDLCSNDCNFVPSAKIVFVTSVTFNGDLGRIIGANTKCNTLAAAANPPTSLFGRNFHAWLGGTEFYPYGWSDENGPYFLPNGIKVIESIAQIKNSNMDSPLTSAINVDENGNTIVSPPLKAWTNTTFQGKKPDFPQGCAKLVNLDWVMWDDANPLKYGRHGSINSTNLDWAQAGNTPCDQSLRLYCFEQ